jgi:hypothetical protein
MSQLKEILSTEQERGSLEQCAVIHLFREGTFYRAYEWSAWLCQRYFTELKVTHRLLKGGEDIIFVGFPLTSLDRYTPEGAAVLPSGDKSIEMTLPAEAFATDIDMESLRKGFEDWKQCQPLTEASKKKVEEERVRTERNAHPRLTDIMIRILAYPIEQHSPMECMTFLAGIKQQISDII